MQGTNYLISGFKERASFCIYKKINSKVGRLGGTDSVESNIPGTFEISYGG